MIPIRRLLTKDDLAIWGASQTKKDLLAFIKELGESVRGHENTDYEEPINQSIESTIALLDHVKALVGKHPVIDGANNSRFGKLEFRDFHDDIADEAAVLIQKAFPSLTKSNAEELSAYFIESWGNKKRIDYGSGHELNFICFLYGLCASDIFRLKGDGRNIVLKIFIRYLKIMRLIETTYWLEPAGSHGVWGLDDYHFLPFLFGAFQLSTHAHLKPISIHNEDIVEMFKDRYMYFGCVAFINSVKTVASLRWHSPMLDDISGVKKWSKVAEGMVKMYDAEVFGKLPIMQHFLFGEVLRCPEGVTPAADHEEGESDEGECCHAAVEHGHAHGTELVNTWGDCCGIKVPSAIAASQMSKKGHKPIPFD